MSKSEKLTHLDDSGKARMVDVGAKPSTRRRAVARGRVLFGELAFEALSQDRLAKGDALGTARLAGVMAAKRTSEWIPLCHQVPLDQVDVSIELLADERRAEVTALAVAHWRTGVEMEALVAVSAACLTLYDMAKAIDRGIVIEEILLMEKAGGQSGHWCREPSADSDSQSR